MRHRIRWLAAIGAALVLVAGMAFWLLRHNPQLAGAQLYDEPALVPMPPQL